MCPRVLSCSLEAWARVFRFQISERSIAASRHCRGASEHRPAAALQHASFLTVYSPTCLCCSCLVLWPDDTQHIYAEYKDPGITTATTVPAFLWGQGVQQRPYLESWNVCSSNSWQARSTDQGWNYDLLVITPGAPPSPAQPSPAQPIAAAPTAAYFTFSAAAVQAWPLGSCDQCSSLQLSSSPLHNTSAASAASRGHTSAC